MTVGQRARVDILDAGLRRRCWRVTVGVRVDRRGTTEGATVPDDQTPDDEIRDDRFGPDALDDVDEAESDGDGGPNGPQDASEAFDDRDLEPPPIRGARAARRTANEDNATVIGQLRIEYADRGVTIALDGDAAARAMAAWRYSQSRRWEDRLWPEDPIAGVPWAAISMESILVMYWLPGLPAGLASDRMAADPTLPG